MAIIVLTACSGGRKKTLIVCVHLFCPSAVEEVHPSDGEAHCGGLPGKPPL